MALAMILLRLFGRLGATIALVVVFVVSLVVGALLHLDTSAGRATVHRLAERLLASALPGDIQLSGLVELDLDELEIEHVRVRDPDGFVVVDAHGVTAELTLLSTIRGLLTGRGLILRIPAVHVVQGEISLATADDGTLRLSQSFAENEPAPPTAGKKPTIELPHITITRLTVTDVPVVGRATLTDLRGAVHASEEVAIYLEQAGLHADPPELPPIWINAGGELHVLEERLAASGHLAGFAGAVPVAVRARLFEDERVAAVVLAGPAGGAALGPWLAALEGLQGHLVVNARLEGSLDSPQLHGDIFHVRQSGAPAQLQLEAGAELSERSQARARLRFTDLDLGAVMPSLPPTDLDGHATVRGSFDGDAPTGELRLAIEPSQIAGRSTPEALFEGRYDGEEATGHLSLSGRGELDADLRYADQSLAASARFQVLDLAALPVGIDLGGILDGTAQATLSLEPLTIDSGRFDLTARRLRVPGVEAAQVKLEGTASGQPENLRADLTLEARGLAAAGERFEWVRAEVRGRGGALDIDARAGGGARIGHLAAHTRFDLDDQRLRDTTLRAQVGGLDVRASAPTIDLGDGVHVPELRLTGLGDDVDASFRQTERGLEGSIVAPRVDLARIERLLGGRLELAGTAAIAATLSRSGGRHQGRLRLSLENAQVATIRGLEGHVEAALAGRELTALGRFGWAELGVLRFELDPVTLGRLDPTTPAAWTRATGRGDLSLRARLDQLETLTEARLLGRNALPVGDLAGEVTLSAAIERASADDPPTVDLSLQTAGLVVAGPVEPPSQFLSRVNGSAPPATAPLRIDDVDIWARLILDGRRDEAEIEIRLTDPHGGLFWLDADARLPYTAIWKRKNLGDPLQLLRAIELEAWAHTDQRPLRELPRALGLYEAKGIGSAQAYFSGSFENPSLGLTIELDDFEDAAVPASRPLDARLVASWKGKTATAEARVGTNRIRLLDARAELESELPALIMGKTGTFRASAEAEMCSVPLAMFQPLSDRGIGGLLTGRVDLTGLGSPEVRLDGHLEAERLVLGRAIYENASVDLHADSGHAGLVAIIRQKKGGARFEADAPIVWTKALPSLERTDRAHVELRARALRLSALEPFVESFLVELDGRLDADAVLELGPTPSLRGEAKLTGGRFQLASFGETFFDARADLRFEPNGMVRLSDFRARSLDGRIEGEGEAKLRGLGLEHARASLRIPDEIPVVLQGQHFGTAQGELSLEARRRGDGYVLDLDVPKMLVEVSSSLPDGVQELAPSEQIRIGTFRRGELVTIPLSPPTEPSVQEEGTPLLVRVDLGEVEVRRGEMLRAYLGGGPRIEIGEVLRMEGTIVIEGGLLEVQGKRFDLERSVITFTDRPPDNPDIMATAVWTAPEGTKVYADYIGPLKTGKVELRSDPPLSKNEIVSLLLFGDAGGAVATTGGSESSGTAGQAVGLGGGIVAQGLNEAISDLTSLDLRAKVTTDRAGGPATELELQLSRKISFAVAHVLGLGDPGRIPDRNFAVIEWRFAHDWSLEASVGDHGSTNFDLLWQHRY